MKVTQYRVIFLAVTMALLIGVSIVAGAQQTVIEFWWGDGAGYSDEMIELIKKFEQEYSWIKIDMSVQQHITFTNAGGDKLKATIAAGVAPDLVYMDATSVPGYAAGGLVIPLDTMMKAEALDSIDYINAVRAYVMLNGRHYGLQFRTDSRGLYYNVDAFLEAGFDASTGPMDLVELEHYAQKLTRRGPGGQYERVGFTPRGANFGSDLGWFWVFGGDVFDNETMMPTFPGNGKHIEALEWLLSYADMYDTPTNNVGNTEFMNQAGAMIVQSTTHLANYSERAPDLNWSVSHIPYPADGRKTTMSTGSAFIVPVGAQNLDAVAIFLEFMAKKESQMDWYRLTEQPPARLDAAMELIRLGEVVDPRAVVMWELLPFAEGYPPLFASHVIGKLRNLTDRMRRREITPSQVLDDLQLSIESDFRGVFHGK